MNKEPATTEQSEQVIASAPKTISAAEVKAESVQTTQKDQSQIKQKKGLKESLKKTIKFGKIDYINVLLILTICVLLIIIIAPPALRKLIPKSAISQVETNESVIILSCVGINQQEQYKINSRTKYVNNIPNQNIIIYTKLDNSQLENELKNNSTITASADSEINFFKTIKGVNIDYNQSNTIVSIYDYIVKKSTSNLQFMNYFQSIEEQESFYELQGYSCSKITP